MNEHTEAVETIELEGLDAGDNHTVILVRLPSLHGRPRMAFVPVRSALGATAANGDLLERLKQQ